jgi:N-acyl-D-aspartate/D-glutamate deacylase
MKRGHPGASLIKSTPPLPSCRSNVFAVCGIALLMMAFCDDARSRTKPADVLIVGGTLVDGTGAPAMQADLAVTDGTISAIGAHLRLRSKTVIDAHNQVVAPGFIDAHNHAPPQLALARFHLNETFIRQGVTTVVGGPDGECSPAAIERYLAAYRKTGVGTNVAFYVGHNSIRTEVMGANQNRAPTSPELDHMRALVREGMQAGALGFSTGLMYSPGLFSETDEVVALAEQVAPFHGIYETHVRDPEHALLQSNWEALEIARQAGLPLDLTHLTTPGKYHRGLMKAVIEQLETARKQGLRVVADQYPYAAIATASLQTVLNYPADLQVDVNSLQSVQAAVRDSKQRTRIRQETLTGGASGFSLFKSAGAPAILVLVCPGCEHEENRFLVDIAAQRQVEGIDALMTLLSQAQGKIVVSMGGFFEEDLQQLMQQPWTMIASDGGIPDPDEHEPHPRFTGTFPRVLGRYVRELHVLTLEDAVRKMTSAPAEFLGLQGRGRLAVGNIADVVIFDAAHVIDHSTWKDPLAAPSGVRAVIVNGVLVLEDGTMTGKAPGRYLKRGGDSEALAP